MNNVIKEAWEWFIATLISILAGIGVIFLVLVLLQPRVAEEIITTLVEREETEKIINIMEPDWHIVEVDSLSGDIIKTK